MDNPEQRSRGLSSRERHVETASDTDVTPDFDEAQKFLTALDETADAFCFQVFDDQKKGNVRPGHRYGTLETQREWLEDANKAGAGIFVSLNETDGKGRKKGNIKRGRALAADFDTPGSFRADELRLEPHIVVNTSPGKYHAYWRVEDLPLDQFEPIAESIAAHLGSDPSVAERARVLRLPGFFHMKAEAFQVTCQISEFADYTHAEILKAFPPIARKKAENGTNSGKVREPGRNQYLTREAGKLRRMGLEPKDIFYLLLKRNREKCDPPIEVAEVRRIAKSIGRYEPENDAPKGYRLIDYSELLDAQPVDWLIDGWIERETINLLFGASSVGKSLVALDMGLSCASGIPWQGVAAKQGAVVYICGEGLNGFKRRIRAWDITNAPHNPRYFLGGAVPLVDELATVSVVTGIRERNLEPALIIVDTLNRCFGGNENGTEDMAKFVSHIDHLRDVFRATILVVHHCGHGAKDRPRGAYALTAAVDNEIRMEKDPKGVVTMTPTKMRDGGYPESRSFKLKVVNIGVADENGNPIDSVILQPAEYTPPDTSNLGGNQANALTILRELFQRHRDNLKDGDYPESRVRVTRAQFYDAWKAKGFDRQRGYEALKSLLRRGVVLFDDSFIVLLDA